MATDKLSEQVELIPDADVVHSVIAQASQVLWEINIDKTYWQMPPFLGTNFVGAYYIIRQYLIAADDAAVAANPKAVRVWPMDTAMDVARLRRTILKQQLKDGSWQNVPNPNVSHGEFDTTLFDYWTLKMMVYNKDCGDEKQQALEAMARAKAWLLEKGGLECANYMSKLWMALLGVYDYDYLYEVPMFIFAYGRPFDVENMIAQWVYPHLIPMAYIRAMKLLHPAAAKGDSNPFRIDELMRPDKMPTRRRMKAWGFVQSLLIYGLDRGFGHNRNNLTKPSLAPAVNRMMEMFCPNGSFGTYTVSTLFTAVALQDYIHRFPFDPASTDHALPMKVKQALSVSKDFVERNYFPREKYDVLNMGAYKGVLDDGRFWDSILGGIAACESAPIATMGDPKKSKEVQDMVIGGILHLLDQQDKTGARTDRSAPPGIMHPSSTPSDCYRRAIAEVGPMGMGGIPYGLEFWYAPDIDDTGETATLMSLALELYHNKLDKATKERIEHGLEKALNWLCFMQSNNGGFGAFHRNRQGNKIVYMAVKQFENAASLFDPPCSDITGHVLEGFGLAGYRYTSTDDPSTVPHRFTDTIRRAVDFLLRTQERDGSFWARWGINYLYGTSAALVGLARTGVTLQSTDTRLVAMVRKALDYLLSRQNDDGGWGEAPQSYDDGWFSNSPYRGRGISTPSHTAWAIMGLLEAFAGMHSSSASGKKYKDAIMRGVRFLVESYDLDMGDKVINGKRLVAWIDRVCVGTGHPSILYMQYPAYSYTFTLMALSRVFHTFGDLIELGETATSAKDPIKPVVDEAKPLDEEGVWMDVAATSSVIALVLVLLHVFYQASDGMWNKAAIIVFYLLWSSVSTMPSLAPLRTTIFSTLMYFVSKLVMAVMLLRIDGLQFFRSGKMADMDTYVMLLLIAVHWLTNKEAAGELPAKDRKSEREVKAGIMSKLPNLPKWVSNNI